MYALCRYKEAFDEANKGFQNELNVTLFFHSEILKIILFSSY